jgi:hypothetical protein
MISARWHEQHPMPKRASLSQRVRWHVAHAKACGCRDIPRTVLTELRRRGEELRNSERWLERLFG